MWPTMQNEFNIPAHIWFMQSILWTGDNLAFLLPAITSNSSYGVLECSQLSIVIEFLQLPQGLLPVLYDWNTSLGVTISRQ